MTSSAWPLERRRGRLVVIAWKAFLDPLPRMKTASRCMVRLHGDGAERCFSRGMKKSGSPESGRRNFKRERLNWRRGIRYPCPIGRVDGAGWTGGVGAGSSG